MKKAFNKDSRRMFKNNLGRFISIVLIIMLGVAFFVGMNEVAPVMKQTAEVYMKEYNIYDYSLISNLGYKEEDVEKLSKIEDVKEAQGVFSYDALTSFEGKDITVRAFSSENNSKINTNYIVEGRNIENDKECLISSRLQDMNDYHIGETISLYRKDDTNIDESLNNKEFEIVGIVRNPIYLSKVYGNTTLLTGDLYGYIIVDKEVFKLENYTGVYIKANIDEEVSRFSKEYKEKSEDIIKKIEEGNNNIAQKKYDSIYSSAIEEINEQEEKIKNVEDYLDEKNNEIKDSQLQINQGIVNICETISKTYNTESIYLKTLDRNNSISILYNELDSLKDEKNELEKKNIDLKNQVENLEDELENLENSIEKNLYEIYSLEEGATKFVSLSKDNFRMCFEYNDTNNQYKNIKKEYDENQQRLDGIRQSIIEKNEELNVLQQEMYSSFEGQKDLINSIGREELNIGFNQIQNSKEEIEKAKSTLENYNIEELLDEAKNEIKNSKNELNRFKTVSETIPLYDNTGFKSLKEDLSKIAIMGRIFPVMFFVIAALVTITTVTRMIETDRKDIGTLKALGYQKKKIIKRYLKYALFAGLLGTILGCLIGSFLIVEILFVSYTSLYDLPNLVTRIKIEYILMALGVALLSTVVIAWVVVKKELKENAAELMRPKTETKGKTILLERFPFIWNKMDFLYKICFRNIFRYKKRLFMTLIGIAGCTALIYAGLGLQSSINSISDKQYKEIRKLSIEAYLTEDIYSDEIGEITEYVLNEQYVKDVIPTRQQSLKIKSKDNEKDIYYMIFDNLSVDKFINLKNRKTQEKIELTDEGVVLTEKLAGILNVSVGEKIDLIDGNNKATLKVIGITENYLYNFAYFTPEVYERIYGSKVRYNELFINIEDDLTEKQEIQLSDNIKSNDKISSLSFNKNIEKEFKRSLASLMSIVILFLVCASILSFTVLINLNNINIEERKRELSTIKLLGFYEKELESYVFRENVILTILGTILGLIIGMGILGIIIQAAEVETIFLVKDINYFNLLVSIVITLAFTLITNILMKKKIKSIDMVESLKSIE